MVGIQVHVASFLPPVLLLQVFLLRVLPRGFECSAHFGLTHNHPGIAWSSYFEKLMLMTNGSAHKSGEVASHPAHDVGFPKLVAETGATRDELLQISKNKI